MVHRPERFSGQSNGAAARRTDRVDHGLGVRAPARLQHELDRRLTDMEVKPLADVFHVEQVGPELADQCDGAAFWA